MSGKRVLSDTQPDLPVSTIPRGYTGGPDDFLITSSNGAFSNNKDFMNTGEVFGFGGDMDHYDSDGPRTFQG